MSSFSLPSTAITSVTTAQQSQYSNVMTSPASFSSGNRNYHPDPVQDEPYLHQWHNGGAVKMTPHLYDAITEKDVEVSRTSVQSCRSTQGITTYQPRKLYIRLTQSQSERVQARLGKEPDAGIAADFGVSETVIRNRRNAQGIAAFFPHKLHTMLTQSQSDSIQARLGKEPDTRIAADFGVSKSVIWERRRAKGIPAYHHHKPRVKFTKSQSDSIQARLGREPDARIAADLGVSQSVIQKHRSAQGIAAFRPHKLYKKLTQSQSEQVQARLGKEPDVRIAADFGVSDAAIQRRRSAQGISAFYPYKKLTQSESDGIQARLGKEPDACIAADFGVRHSMIQKRRYAQGIAAYKSHESHQLHQPPDILPETNK